MPPPLLLAAAALLLLLLLFRCFCGRACDGEQLMPLASYNASKCTTEADQFLTDVGGWVWKRLR